MDTRRAFATLGLLAALILAVVACGGGSATTPSPTTVASPSSAATTVNVTLQEWAIGIEPGPAPAGTFTFAATNKGPADLHEMVVIKTDLSLTTLPADANGVVDEEGAGMEVIGEVEDVAVGATSEVTLTLEPGAYVLICNIYDETKKEAHYKLGMRAPFTVTP